MHSTKLNHAEDECLETNTDIVFHRCLLRNESTLQGQFANMKLVVTENYVFHEILSSEFYAPIRVDGEISLIPHDDNDEIVESYPCLFNQSFFAHFGALAIESMTDGLPTCYWFDTGNMYLSPLPSCSNVGNVVIIYLQRTLIRIVIFLLLALKVAMSNFLPLCVQVVIAVGTTQKQLVKEQLTIGCSTCWQVTS